MSDMIERVAKSQADFDVRPWLSMPRYQRERYIERAKLFLRDISDPTEAMIAAGLNCDEWAEGSDNAVEMMTGIFKAMITAALIDGKGEGE